MDGAIRLKGISTFPISPNPPVGRYYIGVDATDGHLKKQDSSGTVTDYDSGASYTDENAQDAVGAMATNSSTVSLTYNDATPSLQAAVIPGGVNHNALQNYVSNQHIDHSAVSVITNPADGLQGGGDLTANRSLALNFNGLTAKTLNAIGDQVAVYDPNASAHRKINAYKTQFVIPDRYRFVSNDFVIETLGGLTTAVAGTGASAQAGTYGVDLTEQAQGVVQIDTGTTATGRVFIGTASINQLWTASGNILQFGARLAPELLSTNLETFTIYAGFCDNNGAGDATDGCYFRYTDAVNGGKWEAVVAAGATRQAFDTGVLAQTNYQIFEIIIDYTGGNPVVYFYIDGTLTNTVNTPAPIPTGPTQSYGLGWKIEKSVGTTQRNLSADWFYYTLDRNAAR